MLFNLGLKESARFKYKDITCTGLRLKLWFETAGIFVILQSQDGFKSDCPETKFQTITFISKISPEAAVTRCSSTQVLLKI